MSYNISYICAFDLWLHKGVSTRDQLLFTNLPEIYNSCHKVFSCYIVIYTNILT